MIKKNYLEILKKYESNPEIAEALNQINKYEKDLISKNKKLEKKIQDHNLIKGMVLHDLRSPLSSITYMNEMLKEELYQSQEQKEYFHEQIDRLLNRSLNIAKIINLGNISKKELKEESENFSLEEIAVHNGSAWSKELESSNIGLDLKYDRNYGKHIQLYSHKGAFFTIWTTLSGNCINFAPEKTKIKQGIRINQAGNLEMIMENKTDGEEKRKLEGLGKGYGLKFVKEIVQVLNGRLEKYDKPLIDKTYQICQKFGDIEKQKDNKNYESFGIKIIIPKKSIAKQ